MNTMELIVDGQIVLVDAKIFSLIAVFQWSLSPGGYAWAKHPSGGMIMMHRLVWFNTYNEWPEKLVDHINRNRLDNTAANLRLATHTQNGINKTKLPGNSSGYKGVYWDEPHGFWRAQIRKKGRFYHLGYHLTPEDAAIAYNQKAKKLYGAYAVLNELPDDFTPMPRKPKKSPVRKQKSIKSSDTMPVDPLTEVW